MTPGEEVIPPSGPEPSSAPRIPEPLTALPQWTVPLPLPPGNCPVAGPSLGLHRPFCSVSGEPRAVRASRATSVKSHRNACLTEMNFQGEVRHEMKTEKARGLLEKSFRNSGPGCSDRSKQSAQGPAGRCLNRDRGGEGVSPGCLQGAGAEGRGRPLGLEEQERAGGAVVQQLGSVGLGSPLHQLHTSVGGSRHILLTFSFLPLSWTLLDSLHRRFSFLESSSSLGAPARVTASGRTFLCSLPTLRDPSPQSAHTCWRGGWTGGCDECEALGHVCVPC